MYFSKQLYANSDSGLRVANEQWQEVQARRAFFNANEANLSRMANLDVNAGVIPQDVYREFDNVTKRVMRADEGDTILSDLLPLSRAINIGKIEYKFRQASDSGNAKTTLSGQTPITMDKAQYKYDSTIVPVHQDGFGREWRELAGQRSEGFDALIDDQENSVRALRRQMVDYILDGNAGIVFQGQSWLGVRNDSRVASVDLGAGGLNIDFTSGAVAAVDIRNKFKSLRDTLRITNNAMGGITFYVSREIMTNFERYYADGDWAQGTLLKALLELSGVAAIKESSKLTGNQVLAMVLSSEFIMPLVGMNVNTMAIPRQTPFEQHNFLTWGAMGLMIKTDYEGRTGVLYAAG